MCRGRGMHVKQRHRDGMERNHMETTETAKIRAVMAVVIMTGGNNRIGDFIVWITAVSLVIIYDVVVILEDSCGGVASGGGL